nr:HDOD domain-containing protein [Nitrosomonas sp.]
MATELLYKENSSGTDDISSTKKRPTASTKEKLLRAISDDPNLPSLGGSISYIIQLSSSEDESIRQLSHFILSDVSLAQKILCLSNSITFRSSSTQAVTSITKAIFLLGFDTVRTCALAILLVDGMMSGKRAEYVRTELIHALAASMIGRELAKHSQFKDGEEIAVAALFKNTGRLLLAAHDHDKYEEMIACIEQGAHTPEQASMQVLGFSLNDFTETILEKWNIPASIIQAIKSKPAGTLSSPKNKQEWMQQATELSDKAVPLIIKSCASGNLELENKLLARFGKALDLNKSKLDILINDATEETSALQVNVNLLPVVKKGKISADMKDTGLHLNADEDVLTELILADTTADDAQVVQRYPSGKPHNASVLLLAAVQDVAEMMVANNYKLSELVMLILEHYYNSLGFRFVTLCLRDDQKHQYRARSSVGRNDPEYQKAFCFPAILSTDLFYLAMARDTDLFISNAAAPKVRELLPRWHQNLLPDTCSFIVLPLVFNKKPIGFIYADREFAAPEGITSEETRLIKTLKGQILTALNLK